MSSATLKTKVKQLATDLAPNGFAVVGPFLVRRSLPNLDQFLELQPGHRSLEGKFTCNIGWKFMMKDLPSSGTNLHHSIRIGQLLEGRDIWFAHEPKAALDEAYARLLRSIHAYVLPFLNSIDSLEKMLVQHESEFKKTTDAPPMAASPRFFFGRSECWRDCFLGFAYREAGEVEKARQHLREVVGKHSHEPVDWVVNRKDVCLKILQALEIPGAQALNSAKRQDI